MNTPNPTNRPRTLEQILDEARRRVEVEKFELDEARRRRKLIADALRARFPGSRIYYNGSVAHGDALTPLGDVDLGVVVADAEQDHGPGKEGPSDLQEQAAEAIREALRVEFPMIEVEWRDRKRSLLVTFRSPVTRASEDFTADVIIAIDNTAAEGLYIPRFTYWDRAHPEEHTRLVRNAIDKTEVTFARVVRLLKHWNRSNGRPLCTWNIKALALGSITEPTGMLDGLRDWFVDAVKELDKGLTEDPAGVAEKPIKINEDMTRTEVVAILREAGDRLERAAALEAAGYPLQAHEELARMFNDAEMVPYPDAVEVKDEVDRKYAADSAGTALNANVAGASAAAGVAHVAHVGHGSGRGGVKPRSWAP